MVAPLRIPIASDADISRARRLGRSLAATLPFTNTELTAIATAVAELARNLFSYATRGELRVAIVGRDGRQGIRVDAEDTGPGIHDPALAMVDGFSTSGRNGLGLSSVRRLADQFELTSQVGVGTVITLHKWAR